MTPLPDVRTQADRLIDLGVEIDADRLRVLAQATTPDDTLLVPHPQLVPPSSLAPLISRDGKPGFVVVDMTDLDEFGPIDGIDVPDAPFYLLSGLDRGDNMVNWSPDEALPSIVDAGRTPLTINEGIAWLLQQPDQLETNHCFMTIGSRMRKPNGRLDSRTPAIWISRGTGRDGKANNGAPKVGWCWAGNRHTWLGFASAAERLALSPG
ncbi:DUF5701 family protein [Gordonia sp. CPCC 205515]|uniref:DUF5701 family protein n=1 Tax=Gordonia sp. CPCC 205515 TaxID=3140791 RepID=UPI003AF3D799